MALAYQGRECAFSRRSKQPHPPTLSHFIRPTLLPLTRPQCFSVHLPPCLWSAQIVKTWRKRKRLANDIVVRTARSCGVGPLLWVGAVRGCYALLLWAVGERHRDTHCTGLYPACHRRLRAPRGSAREFIDVVHLALFPSIFLVLVLFSMSILFLFLCFVSCFVGL